MSVDDTPAVAERVAMSLIADGARPTRVRLVSDIVAFATEHDGPFTTADAADAIDRNPKTVHKALQREACFEIARKERKTGTNRGPPVRYHWRIDDGGDSA